MLSTNNEDFIYSLFGNDLEPIQINLEGAVWSGFSIIDCGDSPLSIKDALVMEALRPKRKQLVEEHWKICHQHNIRLWSRSGVNLSVFPNLPVLNIAIHEKVGQLPYIKKRKQDRIIEVIQLIYSISPFEIISAEESYMDARFIENISLENAQVFQELILEISLDVLNGLSFLLEDSDDDDALVKTIMRDNSGSAFM
jgi:hypothetical protein